MSDALTFPKIIEAIDKFRPFIEKAISSYGKGKESRDLTKNIKKANAYFKSDQYELALGEYRKLARRFPDDLRPRLGEITVLRKTGKSLHALAACGAALEVSEGDSPREARVYHTMGLVSYELFETYKRKKDLDEAISFFEKAKERQNDQSMLLTLGNIIECCVDGILRAKKTTELDKEKYQEKATVELKLIEERLPDLPTDEKGLGYVIEMMNNLRSRKGHEQLSWLAPFLSALEDRVKKRKLEMTIDDQRRDSGVPSSRRRKNPLVAALAALAIATALAGFLYLKNVPGHDGPPNPGAVSEEVVKSDTSYEGAKKVWLGPGLHIFRMDGELTTAVHDWTTVQIQDYDIDTMTA